MAASAILSALLGAILQRMATLIKSSCTKCCVQCCCICRTAREFTPFPSSFNLHLFKDESQCKAILHETLTRKFIFIQANKPFPFEWLRTSERKSVRQSGETNSTSGTDLPRAKETCKRNCIQVTCSEKALLKFKGLVIPTSNVALLICTRSTIKSALWV